MKQRIITSIFGVAFVLVWLALRDTVVFNIVIAAAVVMVMIEALHSTKIVTNKPLFFISLLFSATVPFIQLFRFFPFGIAIVSVYIFIMLIIMLCQHDKLDLRQVSYTFMMSAILPFSLSSNLYINAVAQYNRQYSGSDGFFFVLLALLGAWIADTGAYFSGRFFGKHKLAPHISPKKTVEGSAGGVLSVVVVYIGVGLVWQFCILKDSGHINFLWLIVLALCNAVAGMIGDLTFSFIKRESGIKDYGNIMPGHGGLLDRIDSVILTAPLTLFFIQLLPVITPVAAVV